MLEFYHNKEVIAESDRFVLTDAFPNTEGFRWTLYFKTSGEIYGETRFSNKDLIHYMLNRELTGW